MRVLRRAVARQPTRASMNLPIMRLLTALSLLLGSAAARAEAIPAAASAPVIVHMETTAGRIVLQLDPLHAPKSVANFLAYVNSGYYEGLIFHRVIPGFMIQGGGYDTAFRQRAMRPPIRNEADNGLKNLRGSIAMARDSRPHSATSEFFINLVDNNTLDAPSFDGWGYAVFGQVIEGMDVVDKIATIATGRGGSFDSDVPQTPVIITRLRLDTPPAAAAPQQHP
jgi:cyclophilin family peptidyl-prolyl cis-trans isomerase